VNNASFDIVIEGIDDCVRGIDALEDAVERATVSSLNKLGNLGITASTKAITKEYNIKTAPVKDGIKLERARRETTRKAARMFAAIRATGRAFPLFAFGGRPTTPASQAGIPRTASAKTAAAERRLKAKGAYPGRKRASVRVRKQTGRATLKHAFVARMKSGHTGIFERTSERGEKGKEKIRELFSVGVSFMFAKRAPVILERMMKDRGIEMFRHELAFYMGRIQARRRAA